MNRNNNTFSFWNVQCFYLVVLDVVLGRSPQSHCFHVIRYMLPTVAHLLLVSM